MREREREGGERERRIVAAFTRLYKVNKNSIYGYQITQSVSAFNPLEVLTKHSLWQVPL